MTGLRCEGNRAGAERLMVDFPHQRSASPKPTLKVLTCRLEQEGTRFSAFIVFVVEKLLEIYRFYVLIGKQRACGVVTRQMGGNRKLVSTS